MNNLDANYIIIDLDFLNKNLKLDIKKEDVLSYFLGRSKATEYSYAYDIVLIDVLFFSYVYHKNINEYGSLAYEYYAKKLEEIEKHNNVMLDVKIQDGAILFNSTFSTFGLCICKKQFFNTRVVYPSLLFYVYLIINDKDYDEIFGFLNDNRENLFGVVVLNNLYHSFVNGDIEVINWEDNFGHTSYEEFMRSKT